MNATSREETMRNTGSRALIWTVAAVLFAAVFAGGLAAETTIEKTDRGARIRTERYEATIANGILTGFVNRLTGEQYLYQNAKLEKVLPHLPGGLGTQHGEEALAGAAELYRIPWVSHPTDLPLPNQHYPSDESRFSFEEDGENAVVLTYRGLVDGTGARYEGETFSLRAEVEEGSGDLMLTASGTSPRPGVYSANLLMAPVDLGVTIEAPVWDGMRITHDMPPRLWRTQWPSYWDHQFIALNGRNRGAVGVWAADAKLRYKDLFYMINDQGVSVSLSSMNTPPFEKLTEAEGVTWHIQAYDHHWTQAAADYRRWREKHREIAERPEWTQQISFVNNGVNAGKMWLDMLSNYFGGQHLERTATFAATIRAANFDTMHYDNRPYEGFDEHMKAWHESGAHLMAYLNPMTMWGREGGQHKRTEADEAIMQMAHRSDTTRIFTGEKGTRHRFYSKHHLGYPEWRKWFVNWVNSYIQEHGADGVYHDETYIAPVDNRGPIDGMTTPQALADYFLEVQRSNPDAIHATEHLQEANLAGASLGIGAGVHWGTAASGMRMQRIEHPSAVSAALHHPHAVIWGFPHQSHFSSRGDMTKYHWGMDQRERRAQIPGFAIQRGVLYRGEIVPFEAWVNEPALDRVRALTFVRHGLRPVFPEDWDENALSYFEGQDGSSFRYERTGWGSRFVRVEGEEVEMIYARSHGAFQADTPGGIRNWTFYNEDGPAGLHPDRYYIVWPGVERAAVHFSGTFTDAYVDRSYANDLFALLGLGIREDMHNIRPRFAVTLNSPQEPQSVKVDGRGIRLRGTPEEGWRVPVATDSSVVVLLRQPEAGIAALQENAVLRVISDVNLDVFDSDWITENRMEVGEQTFPGAEGRLPGIAVHKQLPRAMLRFGRIQALLPFRAPQGEAGTLKVWVSARKPLEAITRDGRDLDVVRHRRGQEPVELKLKTGETILLGITARTAFQVGLEWAGK